VGGSGQSVGATLQMRKWGEVATLHSALSLCNYINVITFGVSKIDILMLKISAILWLLAIFLDYSRKRKVYTYDFDNWMALIDGVLYFMAVVFTIGLITL